MKLDITLVITDDGIEAMRDKIEEILSVPFCGNGIILTNRLQISDAVVKEIAEVLVARMKVDTKIGN